MPYPSPITYSISSSVSGGNVRGSKLRYEIEASPSISPAVMFIATNGDTMEIGFDADLSDQEKSVLDLLVLNHDSSQQEREFESSLAVEASTTKYVEPMQVYLSKSLSLYIPSTYVLGFSAFYRANSTTKKVKLQFVVDGVVQVEVKTKVTSADADSREQFVGFHEANLAAGTHTIQIRFGAVASGPTVYMSQGTINGRIK
jgi:hypothetical protein